MFAMDIKFLCVFLVTFGMTSTKTYYFTTVLRTILTERKVIDIGEQPAFDDIANFDDFWIVREKSCGMVIKISIFRLWKNQFSMVYTVKNGIMIEN